MKRRCKRLMAMFLVAGMCMGVMPQTTMASETQTTEDAYAEEDLVGDNDVENSETESVAEEKESENDDRIGTEEGEDGIADEIIISEENVVVDDISVEDVSEVTVASDEETEDASEQEESTEQDSDVLLSGSCGDELTFVLYESGELVISGEGEMTSHPWTGNYASSVTNVVFDGDVTSICASAFYKCKGLTNITIPDSVTSIGNYTFEDCTRLTSITIPESVISIGSLAFSGCRRLTSITIPDSVTSIGSLAFLGCTSLTSAGPIGGGYSYEFGWTDSIPDSAFSGCSGLNDITLPESITSIGNSAFYRCTNLTNIKIPEGVTNISNSAFSECTGLASIIIPESITSIESYAFSECTGLTSITIPESVVSIGSWAFKNCTGLISAGPIGGGYSIEFGWTDSIPAYAFSGCTGLTSITIPESVTSIGTNAFYSCTGLTSITIPESVTSIGTNAFYSCTGLTNITIPESVTSIGSSVFSRCTGLASITIPESVTSIGSYAFSECTGLASIIIPESVTSIGTHAFYSCTGLINITIPESVTNIGSLAFSGCTSLISAGPIGGGYNYEFGWTDSIPAYAFSECTGLTSITLPENVTSIGLYSFLGCTGLTSITIPESLTSIDSWAFKNCTGLTSAGPIGGGYSYEFGWQESIPDNAFSGCSGLNDITIPESITSIGSHAFSGCTGLTSIAIPENLVSIGSFAFSGCTGLTSIAIPESVASIGSYAFSNCTGLTSAGPIGGGYNYEFGWQESIPDHAFSRCSGLNDITIPESITSIGQYAFSECTGLTCITIPESITDIGAFAFYKSTNFKNVVIPANITKIDIFAFGSCTNLSEIYFYGAAPDIAKSAFSSCTLTSYYYPSDNWTELIENTKFSNCEISWIPIEEDAASIEITQLPDKTTYTLGEELDVSGIVVTATYDTGTEIAVPIPYLSVGAYDFSSAGQKTITITFGELSATFDVEVENLQAVTVDPDEYPYPESEHDYSNDAAETYEFTYSGASRLYVTFSEDTYTESGCDYIEILDGDGNSLGLYDGDDLAGATIEIDGDTFRIYLSSNESGTYYGFSIDSIVAYVVPEKTTLKITSSPEDQCVLLGSTATFTVSAEGDSLMYLWLWSSNSGKTWNYTSSSLVGYNTDTLTVPATAGRNGYQYCCMVTDYSGSHVISDAATLTVWTELTITLQPEDQNVALGSTATFTVTAEGTDLTYQWQWSGNSGSTWNNSSSATVGYNTDTLKVTATTGRNGYQYRCVVTDGYGNSVTSDAAALILSEDDTEIVITGQPEDQTVELGSTATFAVTAEGDSLSYQWQWSGNSGSTWNNSSSATVGYNTDTLNVVATASRNGYQYRCVITDSDGNSVTSKSATLSLLEDAIVITAQPEDQKVTLGSTATFSVAAEGTDLTYQWQWSGNSGSTWNNSSSSTVGYNTDTLKVTATTGRNGYQYRCVITDCDGNSVTSDAATLTLSGDDAEIVISAQPGDQTVELGSTVAFTVVAEGDGLTYQWQWSGNNGKTWNNSSSATVGYNTDTLSVVATSGRNGYMYRCVITDQNGNSITSDTATLNVTS